MIDPANITNFDRTKAELEEFLLFGLCVAGKKATVQAEKLERFLHALDKIWQGQDPNIKNYIGPKNHVVLSPFELLSNSREADVLECMKTVGLGQYRKLLQGFEDARHLDVFNCTLEDLEKCYGVGPKTSRFFLLHSRPNQNLACLDTHVLKYLKSEGFPAPKVNPSKKLYPLLEKAFLFLARENNMTPANFDLNIWNHKGKFVP